MNVGDIIVIVFIISSGYVFYKIVGEPVTLYALGQSVRIKKDEYEKVKSGNIELIGDIEVMKRVIERSKEDG